MFNSISRQKLRHIITDDFPDLLPFVNMLYATQGHTMVKLDDGSWEAIGVVEGFSQGCTLSPIFVGIVLNHILQKLDKMMLERSHERHRQCLELGLSSDDGQGCVQIVMGYMHDINAIVRVEDAAFFMCHFKRLCLPLGTVLNQEKTKVMISTNGHKLTDLLKAPDDPHLRATDEELSQMIRENSNLEGVPHESTDGIRVLETPVGSTAFSRRFISQAMDKVREHSKTILDCLPSRQFAVQLYKCFASHKMTLLFGRDVLAIKDYPRNWNT